MSTQGEGRREGGSVAQSGRSAIIVRSWPLRLRLLIAVLLIGGTLALRLTMYLGRSGPPRSSLRIQPLRIDPNTAPAALLEALPQIGPSLANRIVAERGVRPYTSLIDLRRRVRGLGPATIARLRGHLKFGSEREAADPEPSMVATAVPKQQELSRAVTSMTLGD